MSSTARQTAPDRPTDLQAPDLRALIPEIPFASHLGLRIVELREGRSLLEVDQQAHHHNSRAVAHGGLLSTMIDVAMAIAARSLDADPHHSTTRSVTVEVKVSFMRPGVGRLRAMGRCVHKTATLLFCEADVLDDADRIVARGSGTFKLLRKRSSAS